MAYSQIKCSFLPLGPRPVSLLPSPSEGREGGREVGCTGSGAAGLCPKACTGGALGRASASRLVSPACVCEPHDLPCKQKLRVLVFLFLLYLFAFSSLSCSLKIILIVTLSEEAHPCHGKVTVFVHFLSVP